MKTENKQRVILALRNASEMIRQHVEIGLSPDDVNEEDEAGLREYEKACERASKLIESLAKKIKL